MYSETERGMWEREVREESGVAHDEAINQKYEMREQRIMTETAREKLPGFVESIGRPGYLELRPFYQRRARWDQRRQSRLIESFIMNIPVPPIFLYEKEYGRYELMDGQQRVTAPELAVRRILTSLGAHYRVNVRGLPGRPDIANKSRRKAVFVHGCFWHFHEDCARGRLPSRNRSFWESKLRRNRERDAEKVQALVGEGFDVLVVWECELADPQILCGKLERFWAT